MSKWMGEWVSGWVNAWNWEWMDGWVDECVGWMSEWRNVRNWEWVDMWAVSFWINERVNVWLTEWVIVSECVDNAVIGWVNVWVDQWRYVNSGLSQSVCLWVGGAGGRIGGGWEWQSVNAIWTCTCMFSMYLPFYDITISEYNYFPFNNVSKLVIYYCNAQPIFICSSFISVVWTKDLPPDDIESCFIFYVYFESSAILIRKGKVSKCLWRSHLMMYKYVQVRSYFNHLSALSCPFHRQNRYDNHQ